MKQFRYWRKRLAPRAEALKPVAMPLRDTKADRRAPIESRAQRRIVAGSAGLEFWEMSMPKNSRKILLLVGVLLTAMAIAEQLRRPREERTWQGRILGLPYNLRPPTPQRIASKWWNPKDDQLFVPRAFGVGWDVNLHQLYVMVKQRRTKDSGEDMSRV